MIELPRPAANRVTAQDFYDFHKCPHRVYLNRFGDKDAKRPLSDFLNLIFERAILHEQDVVRDLPFSSPEGATIEEQFVSTLKLMAAGTERVFQGVLLGNGVSGRPDLLEKVPGKSTFGHRPTNDVLADVKALACHVGLSRLTQRGDHGYLPVGCTLGGCLHCTTSSKPCSSSPQFSDRPGSIERCQRR